MVVSSWSDHRANRRGTGFSNDAPPKIGEPRSRVTVVGAERSIRQSCGRIRADAAERRSSANNIIADLGQKCNPKNQHGRKTQKISTEGKPARQGTRAPKTAVIGKPRRTAVQHAAAGDGRRFASRCGRWYNTMQTLYFLPRGRAACAGCGGAGICCAGDPDRKEPFHDPHCHCRG